MKKSGSTILSLKQITSAGYCDAGEVDLRFKRSVRGSKRESLFVSMNTQAIKASIIQASSWEKPCTPSSRELSRGSMLFRQ